MLFSIYFSFTVISIALIASFTIYFQRYSDLYLKLFPFFMLLTTVVGAILTYLSFHGKDNSVPFIFFTTFEFCFYFFVISQIIHSNKAKKIFFYTFIIYPMITISSILLLPKISTAFTLSYSLGCLLIVVFCIFYFLELFQLTNRINLLSQPSFWICSGLLFYFSCSFPLFSLANFLKNPPKIIGNNLTIISSLLDVLLYSSFTIAFLCRIKIRKSTL
jgi:hypothetical protein